MSFPSISPDLEHALEACGRDRVFHNDGTPSSVAVRWDAPQVRTKDEWIVGRAEGPAEGHESAGRKAASAFAARLRVEGSALIAWAERIERALKGGRS